MFIGDGRAWDEVWIDFVPSETVRQSLVDAGLAEDLVEQVVDEYEEAQIAGLEMRLK